MRNQRFCVTGAVLLLAFSVFAMSATVLLPTPAKAQGVTMAPITILPMPRPASLLRGQERLCPYFLRSNITGTDRIDFWYEIQATGNKPKEKTEGNVAPENVRVVIDSNDIPTARPDGATERPGIQWELRMSRATYGENQTCLPPPVHPQNEHSPRI